MSNWSRHHFGCGQQPSVTSVPIVYQRHLGNGFATPADPHHRPIGHGCSQSRHGYINSLEERKSELCTSSPRYTGGECRQIKKKWRRSRITESRDGQDMGGTGEAQRAYFTLPPEAADDYEELKKEILAFWFVLHLYKPRLPARAQAAELHQLAQHWLLAGEPTAAQIAFYGLFLVPISRWWVCGTQPLSRRWVAQERRTPEGTGQPMSRPAVPPIRDELMPMDEPEPQPRAWLAGCTLHQEPPAVAPEVQTLVAHDFSAGTPSSPIFRRPKWPALLKQLLVVPNRLIRTLWRVIWESITPPKGSGPISTSWDWKQKTSPRKPPPSPLIPLPIIEVPFEGHEHILVIVTYATRYPEAIHLRKATAKNIARELFLLFSRVRIPSEILTDQGTLLMCRLMADLAQLLKVKQLRTSVYHPQTDGLAERFNQTLKQMLRRVALEDRRDWDQMVPYVLFGVREVPQHYNRPAQPREFQPGDMVMVLVPNVACKFLATWQGPYTVLEKVGPVTYRIQQPGRRRAKQLNHINLLKKWVGTRDQLTALTYAEPAVVDMNPHLSLTQKTELQHLVGQFSDVFSPLPGQTNIIQHEIRTQPGMIVRQRPYRVPEARWQAIEEEVQQMFKLGVIEPSRSPWLSPIVMVPKPDGTLHFCNDFRRLNEISEFDGYPIPQVDELLDRLGRARFITTLDLTKGYWQVPLAEEAKPKTAFTTPSGHWQYRTLPFGLHGAPATFQRLMDIILRPHQAYATAYIDDVVIHSEHWDEHLSHLRRVLTELRWAGLTANPRKCHLALSEAKYLGYQVGRGLIKPQPKKVEAVQAAPRPSTKTQVQAFLGLAGLPSDRPDQEGAAREDRMEPGSRSGIPTGERSPNLRTRPVSPGLQLSQVKDGEEHPVIYISRKLTKAERNYAAVEKEALAVKWAALELCYYLLRRRFTLVTDHAPLQWMARAKETNARVTRWFLALQDFHFDMRHRSGASNANADGLFRIWSAFAGLSGVTPHPPLIFPLLSLHVSKQDQDNTWRGGGGVTSVPIVYQRRLGNRFATPGDPNHGPIGHGCSQSRHGYINSFDERKVETCLLT
ncbi:hypothetical protein M9458_051302 [Cirrhinus mrigala]|uniref:ribonuclease H n=1 Tax=Cirrhinus mrigala TaxID=683832 RepID=A0ABD0MTM9_CIRMR